MKNFESFREYMSKNNDDIADFIKSKADSFAEDKEISSLMTYDNAYTQIAIMKILEEYHNWLISES